MRRSVPNLGGRSCRSINTYVCMYYNRWKVGKAFCSTSLISFYTLENHSDKCFEREVLKLLAIYLVPGGVCRTKNKRTFSF